MGPLATVDFLHKLVRATPAQSDQDHVPLLVRFCPEVPDRIAALQGHGTSPLPALLQAARALQDAGAQCLVMPCNTAHAWHEAIARELTIPFLHIADSALAATAHLQARGRPGLLATDGTLAARIYHRPATQPLSWLEPNNDELQQWVMPAVRAVKAHDIDHARALLLRAVQALRKRGAGAIVMACTEIPIALQGCDLLLPTIDATEELARACVAWAA
jgi:aspartate racemase